MNPCALVRAVRLCCLGVCGDGTDANLIDAAMQRIMDKSTFIVRDRTWAEREKRQLIGPSIAVSSHRRRLLERVSPLHCHEILTNSVDEELQGKRLFDEKLFAGIDLDPHAPSELPKHVWSETEKHMSKF